MAEWLNAILTRIRTGELLPAAFFAALDSDVALDARDGDEDFAAEWVKLFEEMNLRWTAARIDNEIRLLAEDVRRESFLAASRTTRQHEIASYVSDDFDLITRCKLVGATSEFLAQLWAVYEAGEFPAPPL